MGEINPHTEDGPQANRMPRSLKALVITDTELKLIAAAATIGFKSRFADSG